MSTLEEVNAAIATLQTIAQKLETAKLLIHNQHVYFCQAVELASTQSEQLVLIGAYLATKNLLEDIDKQSNVQHLTTAIDPDIAKKANLQFHFAQRT